MKKNFIFKIVGNIQGNGQFTTPKNQTQNITQCQFDIVIKLIRQQGEIASKMTKNNKYNNGKAQEKKST